MSACLSICLLCFFVSTMCLLFTVALSLFSRKLSPFSQVSFIHSFIRSFIHSFIHSFIYSSIRPSINQYFLPAIHASILSFNTSALSTHACLQHYSSMHHSSNLSIRPYIPPRILHLYFFFHSFPPSTPHSPPPIIHLFKCIYQSFRPSVRAFIAPFIPPCFHPSE